MPHLSVAEPTESGTSPKSRLRIHEDSPRRLSLDFRLGWNHIGFLNVFLVVWNVGVVLGFYFRISGIDPKANGALSLTEWTGFLLFAFVGIGMIYVAGRLMFTRTCLRIEPDRVAVTTTFLGRKSIQETRLDADSTVDRLPRSFQADDSSVLAINIHGVDRTITFGSLLSDEDQQLLIHRIQELTGLTKFNDDFARHADPVSSAPRRPLRTQLEFVEDSPERLEIHIPNGGPRSRWIGQFALCWNLMTAYATIALAFSDWGSRLAEPGMIAMLTVMGVFFWSVGFATAYIWVRMRFTRFNVWIRSNRIVIHRIFVRTTVEESRIDANLTVGLDTKYGENDEAVASIKVTGEDRTIKFGIALSDRDKLYFIRRIRYAIQGSSAA